ncbi:condensation domain-containing protein [Streptomyces sp. NPDC001658]
MRLVGHTHRPPQAREEHVPLAAGQETLWELMRALAPSDPGAARLPVVDFRLLSGELDPAALEGALGDLIHRHHALRTVFASADDEPVLHVRPEGQVPLHQLDLSGLPPAERARQLDALVHRERFAVFDLARGPLWRVHLVRMSAHEYLAAVSFYHVISDGWACSMFFEDWMHAYRARLGRRAPQEHLNVSLQDVADRQRADLPVSDAHDAYWRARLLPLPTRPVFPPRVRSPEADLTAEVALPFSFDDSTPGALREVAWRARTTPFLALLAAYHVLLCHLTRRERLVAGTTTLGRGAGVWRRVVGQFTNNVYLEIPTSGASSFLDAVRATHATMAEAVAHTSSFGRIARAVRPSFDRDRPWPFLGLFDYWFQSAAPAAPDLSQPELSVRQVAPGGQGALDTEAPLLRAREVGDSQPVWARRGVPVVIVDDDRRGGVLVYNRDVYDTGMVAELAETYRWFVAAVVTEPERTLRDVLAALPGSARLE